MLKLAALAAFAYLLGSIPTAYIATKLKKSIDIRKAGTKNVGATNALLIAGPFIGMIVFLFDIFKGLIPVILARNIIGTDLSMGLTGLAAILGHDYSLFLRFTGGKGVATTTGVMFGINSVIISIIIAVWAVLVAITNIFILSSLIGISMIPVFMYFFGLSRTYIVFGIIYFLIGLFAHREDIVRIAAGKEKKAFRSVKKFFTKK
jgi:glycerol-3-phosphate acyltransferase PlsY